MARETMVWRKGHGVIPKSEALKLDRKSRTSKRSKLASPSVVSDIQEYRNVVTGEMVSSRVRHNEILKEHGLVEYGNEKPPKKDKAGFTSSVKDDLKDSINMLKEGYVPEACPENTGELSIDTSNIDVSDVTNPQYTRG